MGATELRATLGAKATTFKNAFRSREGFKYFIETHDTALDQHGHPGTKQSWSNEDLDPTPPEKRTCMIFKPSQVNFTDNGQGGGGIS
jgi:nucleobase:cation symporter-1, NCS1 family